METWLVVWLVVGLVTTVALLVMLAFLVRHVILLGRQRLKRVAVLRIEVHVLAPAGAIEDQPARPAWLG